MAKSLRELYSKMGIEMEKLIIQSYRVTINPYSDIIKIAFEYFFVRVLQTNSKTDDKQRLLRQKKKKENHTKTLTAPD